MFNDRYGTFLSVLIAIATIFYLGLDIQCATSIDPVNVLRNLRSKLYGQNEVIENLRRVINSKEKVKLIVFVGGIGNGKTYASEIISENVNNTHNFQRLVFQSLDETKMNLSPRVLKTCDYNMIVVDDLSVDNVDSAVYLVDYISSQIDLQTNNKVDIILIFNTENISQDTNEKVNTFNVKDYITNHLQVLDFPIFMIEFKKLNEISIKKCVVDSLNQLSLEPTQENVNKVMKLLEPTYSGCKEVHAKASLI